MRLAIVDLDRDDAESMLSSLAESRPDLPVVVRTARGGETIDEARAVGLKVVYTYARQRPPRDAIEHIRECAMHEDPSSLPTARPVAPDEEPRKPSPSSPTEPSHGDLSRVPRLIVALDDVGWFDLDADAVSLVHCVDGEADLRTLAHRCGLPPDEVLRIARALVRQDILAFE